MCLHACNLFDIYSALYGSGFESRSYDSVWGLSFYDISSWLSEKKGKNNKKCISKSKCISKC